MSEPIVNSLRIENHALPNEENRNRNEPHGLTVGKMAFVCFVAIATLGKIITMRPACVEWNNEVDRAEDLTDRLRILNEWTENEYRDRADLMGVAKHTQAAFESA